MHSVKIGVSPIETSRLAYGCWRTAGSWDPAEVTDSSRAAGIAAIQCAYETGYRLFDTADIYTRGESEILLGESLRRTPGMRDKVVIATKCGIRFPDVPPGAPQRYDFSAEHIESSCEGSLKRLGIETIDVYMLHRPDYLADPSEIAQAFSKLQKAGKVRYFGVSNFRPSLVTALQVACPMPLVVHQIEMSLARLAPLEDGTLDQCLIEKITPMAWSPLGGGLLGEGARHLLPSQESYKTKGILPALDDLASAKGVSRSAIALAWLLRHPAGVLPILGSNDPQRIREASRACEVNLTREEWYRLLLAARGEPLP